MEYEVSDIIVRSCGFVQLTQCNPVFCYSSVKCWVILCVILFVCVQCISFMQHLFLCRLSSFCIMLLSQIFLAILGVGQAVIITIVVIALLVVILLIVVVCLVGGIKYSKSRSRKGEPEFLFPSYKVLFSVLASVQSPFTHAWMTEFSKTWL